MFNFFRHGVDFVILSNPKRITAKVVEAQHNKALAMLDGLLKIDTVAV